jgi:hypothetical protein
MFTEKDFWDYFSEETIIIDLISTQKPEEPRDAHSVIYVPNSSSIKVYRLDNREITRLKSYPPVRKTSPTFWLFGLCYAMDGGYKGWNPYRERHLAIFVNCFCSRAN